MRQRTLILIVLAISFVSRAQSQLMIKHYGFKAGVTSANQTFDYTYLPNNETKRRVGFNLAGYLEWFDSRPFTFVAQLEYVQKGVGQQFAITSEDPNIIEYKDYYWRLDYLSLPLLAKLSLSDESFIPFLIAGPRVDILLGYVQDEADFSPLYDKFKKTVLGGTIGGGLEFSSLLSVPLIVEARYNIDLADSYSTEFLKVRNNSFDIWLGIKL